MNDHTSSAGMVVMYHYVRDIDPSTTARIDGMTVREFEDQIDELSREMEPIDWPSLLAWSQGRRALPERFFLLTFDDGLADHASNVVPILNRRGLRGVFFMPGQVLVDQKMLTAHAIHLLLGTLEIEGFTKSLVESLEKETPGIDWIAKVDAEEASALYDYEPPQRAIIKYLLSMVLPVPVRHAAIERMFHEHIGSSNRWAKHWYMSWEEIIEMESLGHTIGSHGFSHEPLTRFTTQLFKRDAQRSAAVLNEGLGCDVRPISFPYGRWSPEVCTACRDAGFVHGFSTDPGLADSTCDPMHWPRIDTINVTQTIKERLSCLQIQA